MASLKSSTIVRNLSKKGFKKDTDSDHIWLILYTADGKKSGIDTKVSHSKKEIGEPLLSQMAKDIKLKKADFIEFAKCSISEKTYKQKLKQKGYDV